MKRLLEVCAGSLQSALAAAAGGAERLELCAALPLDGLTPSVGLLQTVRHYCPDQRIRVLIRPREGHFVYSEAEVEAMLADIEALLLWADGIVGGALTAAGDLDVAVTRRLVEACQGKPFTFHRAFDVCREPLRVLHQLIDLGCARLLTSGQQPSALQGAELNRQLVDEAAGHLVVMPGGGVSAANAAQVLRLTGATEIHGSARGGGSDTSAAEVEAIRQAINF